MTEIISIRFKSGGKHYFFDPNGLQPSLGQAVVVETSRGLEYGECVASNRMVDDDEIAAPLRPAVRLATEEDHSIIEKNKERQHRAQTVCRQKILEHGLDMKLVEAEYSFEGNKVIFFFTSEGRVDFRALVKDLAATLHARIELRQIGVRDESKIIGGLGICGRPLCCSQFLDEFQPVSIKMAKTQNLSLNPTKISGTCGRLMCCLKYEQDAYEDLIKRAPKAESFVETPDGAGNVTNINLLREKSNVRLDSDPETPRTYHNCELRVIRNGKGKRPEDYVAKPLSELESLRMVKEPVPEPTANTSPNSLAAALEAVFSGKAPDIEGDQPQEEHASRSRRRSRHSRAPRQDGAHTRSNANHADKPRQKTSAPTAQRDAQSRPPKPPRSKQQEGAPQKPQQRQQPHKQQPAPAQRQQSSSAPQKQQAAPTQKQPSSPAPQKPPQEGAANKKPRRRRRPKSNGDRPTSGTGDAQ